MTRLKLQNYSDGAIYKNQDSTYTVETSLGKSTAKTVELAIKGLVKKTKKASSGQDSKSKK